MCWHCKGNSMLGHGSVLISVKGKSLVLSPVEKMMPSMEIAEKLLWTGDRRSVSASLYLTRHLKGKTKSMMTIFKTCAAHFLLFILKQRNQRMLPCPPNPNLVLGSTKLAKAAFRNNVLSSKPFDLILFSLAGHLLAGTTWCFTVPRCHLKNVLFSLSRRGIFCHQFALLQLMETYQHLIK